MKDLERILLDRDPTNTKIVVKKGKRFFKHTVGSVSAYIEISAIPQLDCQSRDFERLFVATSEDVRHMGCCPECGHEMRTKVEILDVDPDKDLHVTSKSKVVTSCARCGYMVETCTKHFF